MISLETTVHVSGARARDVFAFMLSPSDEQYQKWWPATHLQFHELEHRPGYLGSSVYMDEFVGGRRLRMSGIVTEVLPDRRIVWTLRAPLHLPARVSLDLIDGNSGVTVTHTTQAGFTGVGALLDPILRLYFSRSFSRDLDAHVQTEFTRLGELLSASTRRKARRAAPHAQLHGGDGPAPVPVPAERPRTQIF
jgi:uncharacterized protein YndB with AHSA1/START domain